MSYLDEKKIEKNQSLNFMKAIACLSVIALHCPIPGWFGKLYYGFARFAVPFFFMISGYFVYKEDNKNIRLRLQKKIKHIIKLLLISEIIYFIWHIIQYYILYGIEGSIGWFISLFTFSNLIKLLIFQSTMIGDVSWFLIALLLCYIVTFIIAKNDLWNISAKLSTILLVVNVILGEITPFYGVSVQWYWCSNFWLLGFPFYSFGYWISIHKHTLCKKFSNIDLCKILLISMVVNILERIMTDGSQFFLSNAFIAFSIFMICIKNPIISKTNIFKYIENIGEKYAVYVYIFHPIIRDILTIITEIFNFSNTIMYQWIQPVLVFWCCIIIGSSFEVIKKLIIHANYNY